MRILVLRHTLSPLYTEGVMLLDGVFFGYTIEDTVRDPGVKIPGETAIPAGTYSVTVEMSPRLGKELPRLHDVPGFDGILIHGGNTAKDSLGCILVASNLGGPGVIVGSLSLALTSRLKSTHGPHDIKVINPK